MRIIIVGAGLVGTQLARHLIEEKHDIAIIEANEERARHVSNRLDCMVLQDEGNSINALEEAGIAKAEALICVTDSDEVNMIICGLASRYPKLLKIARVRNDEYVRRNFQNQVEAGAPPMGIDYFVHPDVEAARSALDAIEHGAIGNILSFAGSPYELGTIDVAAHSAFDGLTLKDFRTILEGESLITLVERKGKSFLPTGSTKLQADDRIYLLAKEEELNEGFKLAGRSEKPIHKIGIVGGGRLGSLIAAGLLSKERRKPNEAAGSGMDAAGGFEADGTERKKARGFFSFLKTLVPRGFKKVLIIEQDYGICKDLAARFPDALILNEDISDESFVAEEHIDDLDLIVTATDLQELNIITAVYLKSRGVTRTIAMVTGSGYAAIARQLGVDVVIPMKDVVVDSILSKLMGGGVKGVHRLGDGTVGILEIDINPGSQPEGKSLKDFHLPEGALVMLVNRGVEVDFIPRGGYVYTAGDRILLIARNGSEMDIERIFSSPVKGTSVKDEPAKGNAK
ncbi:Trk system potassium transport protein TrkA [Spirochaetia bacterium]|nr:Trk system potassium transport protein TrkA [Spirochaetia bacterium]